jgi:hypothetical protein
MDSEAPNPTPKLLIVESDKSDDEQQEERPFIEFDLPDDDSNSDQWRINMIDPNEIVYAKKAQVKLIGQFYMCHTLGEGSYSKVREAMHKETMEKAAVKIMSQQRLRKIPNGTSNAEKYNFAFI